MNEGRWTESAPGRKPASAELLHSLGRLVRGLSALFWGLPIALLVGVQTARTDLLGALGVVPPVAANGLLLGGLCWMGGFRRGERVWRRALDRARFVALVNVGLAPFLYWWRMAPQELHFRLAVALLAICGLVFLLNLNAVIRRLTAMLPDETLRLEAQLFTTVNTYLLLGLLLLLALWMNVNRVPRIPFALLPLLETFERAGLAVALLFVLLPVALTMAMLWKVKETVLAGVFAAKS